MRKRAASDNSSAVNLFPFLAVLLCTMGALLVLLVILAQRAGQQAATDDASAQAEVVAQVSDPEAEELVRQLAAVREYQEKIRELQLRSKLRLKEEQQRLTHLEDHARRLEEELAKLFLASQQLKATESNRTVDQQRAERELKHLQQRIEASQATLDDMREEAPAKKSFAIVPYKGPNGTFRQPIFVECSAEGVVIRPEGIRLKQEDFARPLGPGNPLAAALRAAKDHLNARAARAGRSDLPDPYPMIVVRPDGILQYHAARQAISSWDADFGYVFVEQDLPIEFSQLDPQLAKVEHHAVLQAREMRNSLARAAPSRYRGSSAGRLRSAGVRGGSQGFGGSGLGGSGGDAGSPVASSGTGDSPGGGGQGTGDENSMGGAPSGLPDGAKGDSQAGTSAGANGNAPQGEGTQEGLAQDSTNKQTGEAASAAGSGGQGSAGEQFTQSGGETGSASGSSSGTASSGSPGTPSYASGGSADAPAQPGNPSASLSFSKSSQPEQSIAQTQGTDWAVRSRQLGAVPIRRPIHVIIRKDRLAILPENQKEVDSAEDGTVISLNQSLRNVSGELTTALRGRIDDWGLAGNGLFWRPVLVLNVGPDAEQTASQLMNLLENSGVEIRSPETAQNTQGGRDHVVR